MNIHFRPADERDADFITEGIISSEKSGTEILSYCKIFNIDEKEVVELVKKILNEEIEGQEWNTASFLIAETEGAPAACLSAWIEGECGISSGILKAQAMSYFLGNIWLNAENNLRKVSQIQLPRMQRALQLENIYTASGYRGKGIAGQLIEHAIIEYKNKVPELQFAEIQLMGNNQSALNSYTKCGFLKHAVSAVSEDNILHLLPGNFRVSLTKNV